MYVIGMHVLSFARKYEKLVWHLILFSHYYMSAIFIIFRHMYNNLLNMHIYQFYLPPKHVSQISLCPYMPLICIYIDMYFLTSTCDKLSHTRIFHRLFLCLFTCIYQVPQVFFVVFFPPFSHIDITIFFPSSHLPCHMYVADFLHIHISVLPHKQFRATWTTYWRRTTNKL